MAGGVKNGDFCCGFSQKSAKLVGFLVTNRASFEGRRGQRQGQGAGVVQRVWMGVEMWEMGSLVEPSGARPHDGLLEAQLGHEANKSLAKKCLEHFQAWCNLAAQCPGHGPLSP